MQTASTKEMMACTRINPESVFQIRVSISVRCQPTLWPVVRRIMGRKPSPSFKKKKVSTSMSTNVTTMEPAVEMPLTTRDAMSVTRSCRNVDIWLMMSL